MSTTEYALQVGAGYSYEFRVDEANQLTFFPELYIDNEMQHSFYFRVAPEYQIKFVPNETQHTFRVRGGGGINIGGLVSFGLDGRLGVTSKGESVVGIEFNFLDRTRAFIPGFFLFYDAAFVDESTLHFVGLGLRWAPLNTEIFGDESP